MLKYVTREEYAKLLDADSIPDNFENLSIQASNYIDYHTHQRIDKNNVSEKVKYVTCLIIDITNEENQKLSEIGNLKAQNIEGWSETYSTPEEVKNNYASKKFQILKEFLMYEIGIDGNPLLYCGVC